MIPKMSLIGCRIQDPVNHTWRLVSLFSFLLSEGVPYLAAFCCFGILGLQASRLVEYPAVWVCLVAPPDYMQLNQTFVKKETR